MIGANQLQYIEEIHIQNDATKRPRWIEDEHFNEFKNRVFFSFQYNVKAFEFFLREESDSLNAEMLELMFWSKLYKNLVLRNLVKKMCTRCSGKFWRGK